MNDYISLFSKAKRGTVKIEFRVKGTDDPRGGGTGFLVDNWLITNNHVYIGYLEKVRNLVVCLRIFTAQGYKEKEFTPEEFAALLVAASPENECDYAILRADDIAIFEHAHKFELEVSSCVSEGFPVAFLGFPFKKNNITCHVGYISGCYEDRGVNVLQIDGSVNPGNSGGPLINYETGCVIGMITRAETGFVLSAFNELQKALESNVDVLSSRKDLLIIDGISPIKALEASQRAMSILANSIKRSVNVGIGYAFSIDPILIKLGEQRN